MEKKEYDENFEYIQRYNLRKWKNSGASVATFWSIAVVIIQEVRTVSTAKIIQLL